MIEVIKSDDRGKTNINWLQSYHSFSFGEYYDPDKIHFGPLRVLNDDLIKPGEGFPTHPHNDMEIVTIVVEGKISHKDSTGNIKVVGEDEIQRMTAGSGIFHSEFNDSATEVLKLYQIWIFPNAKGLTPSYQQIKFLPEQRKNSLLKVVSGEKEDGVIFINQNARIYLSDLDESKTISYDIADGRGVYIHVIEGSLNVNGENLEPGDAAQLVEESNVSIQADTNSRLMLFDLPMRF